MAFMLLSASRMSDTTARDLEKALQMSLPQRLAQKKKKITQKWFEAVINTYPVETARFLKRQSNPFANPVGQTTKQNLDVLFDLLIADLDHAKAEQALDPIIRIRAIQEFTPAQATRFVFDLKTVIHDILHSTAGNQQSTEQMLRLDRRIDELALIAFNIYMKCREKIYELKANEIRSRTFKAFARAGLIKEPPDDV